MGVTPEAAINSELLFVFCFFVIYQMVHAEVGAYVVAVNTHVSTRPFWSDFG